jgi:hypothetical protein
VEMNSARYERSVGAEKQCFEWTRRLFDAMAQLLRCFSVCCARTNSAPHMATESVPVFYSDDGEGRVCRVKRRLGS